MTLEAHSQCQFSILEGSLIKRLSDSIAAWPDHLTKNGEKKLV